MNSELDNIRHPGQRRIKWIIFYSLLFVALIAGFYNAASKITTHASPVGQIELSIPYSKYVVGEPIDFTITNNMNGPIYISNKCPTEPLNVYRQENDKWVRIHDQADIKDCPNEGRMVMVPANTAITGSFASWHHLYERPGKYRIVAVVEHYDALPYQDFEVVAKPQPQTQTQPKTSAQAQPKSPTQVSIANFMPQQTPQPQPKPKTITLLPRPIRPPTDDDHKEYND